MSMKLNNLRRYLNQKSSDILYSFLFFLIISLGLIVRVIYYYSEFAFLAIPFATTILSVFIFYLASKR